MAKRQGKRETTAAGQPSAGSDDAAQEMTDRGSDAVCRDVFKEESEGVGRTVPPDQLAEPDIGEWLPGFRLPLQIEAARTPEAVEEPLPAWAGSYELGYGQEGGIAELIYGRDDRIRISNTRVFPFRAICQLLITSKSGRSYLGTGWLGGNRIVYTAGHCTFMHREGGLVSRISVIPARNGASQVYSPMNAVNWGCTQEWSKGRSQELDIGCIFLGQDCAHIGNFGFDHPYSESQLMQLKLHIAGYPGDKPHGEMWGHANQLIRVYPKQLNYAMDTMGGQSGAPVFTSDGMVVGIHNYGANVGNLGSRINADIKATLKRWWALSGSTV